MHKNTLYEQQVTMRTSTDRTTPETVNKTLAHYTLTHLHETIQQSTHTCPKRKRYKIHESMGASTNKQQQQTGTETNERNDEKKIGLIV